MGSQIRESSQMLRTDEVTDLLWKLHLGNSLRHEYILPHSHQEPVQWMLCSETKVHTETCIPLWQLGLLFWHESTCFLLSLGRHNPVPSALYGRAPELHQPFLVAILHSE